MSQQAENQAVEFRIELNPQALIAELEDELDRMQRELRRTKLALAQAMQQINQSTPADGKEEPDAKATGEKSAGNRSRQR